MNPFYFFKVQKSLKTLFYIGSNNCIVKLSPPLPLFRTTLPSWATLLLKNVNYFCLVSWRSVFLKARICFWLFPKFPPPHAYKSPKYRDAGLTSSLAVTHHHLVLPWNSSRNCVVSSHCFLSHLRHETTGKESQELIRYLLLSSWNLPRWFRQ